MTDRKIEPVAVESYPRMLHKWHDRILVHTLEEMHNAMAEGYAASHALAAKAVEAQIAEDEQLGLRARRSDAARQADWAVGQVEEAALEALAGDTSEVDAVLGLPLAEILAHVEALTHVPALLVLRAREAAATAPRRRVLRAIDARLAELGE